MSPLKPHLAITLPKRGTSATQEFICYALYHWGGEGSMGNPDEKDSNRREFGDLYGPEQLVFSARVQSWATGGPASKDEAGARLEAAAMRYAISQVKVTIESPEDFKAAHPEDELVAAKLLRPCAKELGVPCPEQYSHENIDEWADVIDEVCKALVRKPSVSGCPQVLAREYIFAAMSFGVLWSVISHLDDMKYEVLDPQRTKYPYRSHYHKVSPRKLEWLKRFFEGVNNAPLPRYQDLTAYFATPSEKKIAAKS